MRSSSEVPRLRGWSKTYTGSCRAETVCSSACRVARDSDGVENRAGGGEEVMTEAVEQALTKALLRWKLTPFRRQEKRGTPG